MTLYRAALPRLGLWALGLLVLIVAANVLSIRQFAGRGYGLDVGARFDPELQFIQGVYQPESDENSMTYRWTQGRSAFMLRGFLPVPNPVLVLDVGGVPAGGQVPLPVVVTVDDAPVTTLALGADKRSYEIALPADALADGDLTVQFTNPTVQIGGDERTIGFRLDALALRWDTTRMMLPLPTAILAQWALVLIWLGVLIRLGAHRVLLGSVAVGLVALLAFIAGPFQLVAMAWTMRLVGTGALVLLLAWNGLRWLVRWEPAWANDLPTLRWICVVTVAAIAIRLFAVYFPFWESHDLYIHRDRLSLLQLGSLHLYDRPSEFGGRRTIVPPAYYLMSSPVMLVANHPGVPLQGIYALTDGFNPLLAALFVRRLGGRARAALVAAIMIAVLPIQWTALWWGFGPQVVGQALVLALALLMTRIETVDRRILLWGVFVLSLIFLMHPGVAVLTAFWLGLSVLLVWWFERARRLWWLGWGVVVAITGVIVTVAIYVDVIALQLEGVSQGSAARPDFTEADRIRLTLEGMGASLRPVGFVLMVLGAVALLRVIRRPQRWLIVASLGSAALFFAVDLATALQVRYAYFAIAPLCAGLGVLLDGVMQRGRVGKVVAWSFIAFVVCYGLILWIGGVFFGLKPTLTALLH